MGFGTKVPPDDELEKELYDREFIGISEICLMAEAIAAFFWPDFVRIGLCRSRLWETMRGFIVLDGTWNWLANASSKHHCSRRHDSTCGKLLTLLNKRWKSRKVARQREAWVMLSASPFESLNKLCIMMLDCYRHLFCFFAMVTFNLLFRSFLVVGRVANYFCNLN